MVFLYFKWLCGTTFKKVRYFPHTKKPRLIIFLPFCYTYVLTNFFFKIEKNVYQKVKNRYWVRVFFQKIPCLYLTYYSGLMKSMTTTTNGAPCYLYPCVYSLLPGAMTKVFFVYDFYIILWSKNIVFLFVCFL